MANNGVANQWATMARRIRVPAGFCFAALYLWRARPTLLSIALSLLAVVPGLILRAYASGFVRKDTELTTTGPYAYTRNPLYMGSLLIAFGFAAASRRVLIVLLVVLLFALIYLPTIASEEAFLSATFPEFESYAQRVPRLVPVLIPRTPTKDAPVEAPGAFSAELYRKHREYNALLGVCAIYAALIAGALLRR